MTEEVESPRAATGDGVSILSRPGNSAPGTDLPDGQNDSRMLVAELLGDIGVLRDENRDLRQQLAETRSDPLKSLGDLAQHHMLVRLARLCPPLPRRMVSRFARSAAKRNPLRSLEVGQSVRQANSAEAAPVMPAAAPAAAPLNISRQMRAVAVGGDLREDPAKSTIMVVSHEASRTGAPILALNLVQKFSLKYNVVSVSLGGGPLLADFQARSVATYEPERWADRKTMDAIVSEICQVHGISYAVVNSAESRNILPSLKSAGVPVVSLLHEFAAYTRPRTSFADIFDNSDQVIFSTRITLENALEELQMTRGAAIHIMPQGKCIVPRAVRDEKEDAHERMRLDSLMGKGVGEERDFVVLGAGTVEPRKAVELFIECATRVINAPGGGRYRFVWIGHGYDPETGAGNAFYLADQIRRAGIKDQVSVVRATSEIEYAYELADMLLLSSRLDPLPNVAIDALVAGKPVLCFERTTGVVDFLVESGLGDTCVARYLDTTDLAAKIRAIAEDEDLRTRVCAISRAAAVARFDFDRYVAQIEQIALSIVPAAEQREKDAAVISASGRFRADFYGSDAPEPDAIRAYLEASRIGRAMRKPMPGFHPAIYQSAHEHDIVGGDPFVRFLTAGEPQGPWAPQVVDTDTVIGPLPLAGRSVLHLHVQDPAAVADLAERLRHNTHVPDLVVSVSAQIAEAARAALNASGLAVAHLQVVPERGGGLGAMATVFAARLSAQYDLIGHLELGRRFPARPAMSGAMLETMIGGASGGPMMDRVVSAMAADPTIGLAHPDDPAVAAWGTSRSAAEVLAPRLALGKLPDQVDFPTGGAFWCRSEVLTRLASGGFEWADYPSRSDGTKGQRLEALARLVGILPRALDRRTIVMNVRGVSW